MSPVVPSLLREVRLRWRGVVLGVPTNATKASPYFSGEHRHEGLVRTPLSGCLKVATGIFT
jgi:hypothetical protein